jgi:hypothetical protein
LPANQGGDAKPRPTNRLCRSPRRRSRGLAEFHRCCKVASGWRDCAALAAGSAGLAASG